MERNDCSLLRSNSSRKPMASRKKAVVRLRNLVRPRRVGSGRVGSGQTGENGRQAAACGGTATLDCWQVSLQY